LFKLKPRVIDVEIYDQQYSIVPMFPMQECDVETLADDIDRRMREIASVANTADSLKIAVLTALHLAQELRDLKSKTEEWNDALEQLLGA
jgi:cell division protein ZapA (FtsZ GTPase activity inhibitor)